MSQAPPDAVWRAIEEFRLSQRQVHVLLEAGQDGAVSAYLRVLECLLLVRANLSAEDLTGRPSPAATAAGRRRVVCSLASVLVRHSVDRFTLHVLAVFGKIRRLLDGADAADAGGGDGLLDLLREVIHSAAALVGYRQVGVMDGLMGTSQAANMALGLVGGGGGVAIGGPVPSGGGRPGRRMLKIFDAFSEAGGGGLGRYRAVLTAADLGEVTLVGTEEEGARLIAALRRGAAGAAGSLCCRAYRRQRRLRRLIRSAEGPRAVETEADGGRRLLVDKLRLVGVAAEGREEKEKAEEEEEEEEEKEEKEKEEEEEAGRRRRRRTPHGSSKAMTDLLNSSKTETVTVWSSEAKMEMMGLSEAKTAMSKSSKTKTVKLNSSETETVTVWSSQAKMEVMKAFWDLAEAERHDVDSWIDQVTEVVCKTTFQNRKTTF